MRPKNYPLFMPILVILLFLSAAAQSESAEGKVYKAKLAVDNDAAVTLADLRVAEEGITDDSGVDKTDPHVFKAEVLSKSRKTLSELYFKPSFVVFTDPPTVLDRAYYVLRAPYSEDAEYLKVYFQGKEKLSVDLKDSVCNNDKTCNNYESHYSCPNDCDICSKDNVCASSSNDGCCDTDCFFDNDCKPIRTDKDRDSVTDSQDNCQDVYNPDQNNTDADVEKTVQSLYEVSNSLALHLSFDEGSGFVAEDSSGNSNNGAISGATYAEGKSGKAINFDGIDDFISVPSSESLKPSSQITLSCWVKLNSYIQAANVWPFSSCIYKTSGPTARYVVGYGLLISNSSGIPAFVMDDNDVTNYAVWGSAALPLNEWHHVAGTYDGSAMALYVDGVLKGTAARTGPIDNSDYPLNIGNTPNEYAQPEWYSYFNGAIDDVRIYSRALSANEVYSLYEVAATAFKGDEFGDACDSDDDNDGVLDENDLCSATIPSQIISQNGCSCEQIEAKRGDGGFMSALNNADPGIMGECNLAAAQGLLAKTGMAFGLGQTTSDGISVLLAIIVILAALYYLTKRER